MIAAYGSKTFVVSHKKVLTLQEYSRTSSLAEEDVEVEGKKPSTYIKGSTLEKVSFNIILDKTLGVDVDQEVQSWITLKDSSKPQTLSIGGKPVTENKFLLIEVQESSVVLNSAGKKIKTTLGITLKEYVRAGKPDKNKMSMSAQQSNAVVDLLVGDKSDKKRENTTVQTSKAFGPKPQKIYVTKSQEMADKMFGIRS